MNTMKKQAKLITVGLALTVATTATQAYLANANTGPSSTTQLWLNAGQTIMAPTGTVIQFVADLSLNGVPTAPTQGSILGGDDVLLWTDIVDGSILGAASGRFTRNSINVDGIYSNANIWVYLWNVQPSNIPVNNTNGSVQASMASAVGLAGQTFGLLNLGVITTPGIGNALWNITSAIQADQYSVIPEPSSVALAALGLIGLVVIRRKK